MRKRCHPDPSHRREHDELFAPTFASAVGLQTRFADQGSKQGWPTVQHGRPDEGGA